MALLAIDKLCGSGERFTIPSNFKAIYGPCGYYEEVIVPEGVLVIGNVPFSSDNIRKLILPDSLESVGEQAFLGSNNLSEIEWNGNTYDGAEAFLDAFESTGR